MARLWWGTCTLSSDLCSFFELLFSMGKQFIFERTKFRGVRPCKKGFERVHRVGRRPQPTVEDRQSNCLGDSCSFDQLAQALIVGPGMLGRVHVPIIAPQWTSRECRLDACLRQWSSCAMSQLQPCSHDLRLSWCHSSPPAAIEVCGSARFLYPPAPRYSTLRLSSPYPRDSLIEEGHAHGHH